MSIDISVLGNIFDLPGINWDLLSRCRVVSEVLTQRQQFANFFHRWYLTDDGRVAEWNWYGARPVKVLELADNEYFVNFDSRIKILRMRCIMGQLDAPLRERILTYALPGGAQLILAGNHRTAALTSKYCQSPIRVSVTTILGPIDGDILPDLWHFQQGGVPSNLVERPNLTDSTPEAEDT